jgi:hypothetical protein
MIRTVKINVEFIVYYCNLFLLHLISGKIWLPLRSFVSLAPEQRNLQWPSNIAVIVTSLYVQTVSASTEHLKPLYSHHVIDAQVSQYLTAIEDFVALEQGSQSCEEEAISFLRLSAIKIDYNSTL